jgi:hypothetical protein
MAHLLLTQLTGKRFERGRGSLIARVNFEPVTLLPFEPPMAVMPPPAACIPTSVTASQLTVIPRTPRTRHRSPSDARTTYQRFAQRPARAPAGAACARTAALDSRRLRVAARRRRSSFRSPAHPDCVLLRSKFATLSLCSSAGGTSSRSAMVQNTVSVGVRSPRSSSEVNVRSSAVEPRAVCKLLPAYLGVTMLPKRGPERARHSPAFNLSRGAHGSTFSRSAQRPPQPAAR